ncbi:aldo/keto reductase [Phytoactinopolyspora limicola]|uniref:aldo/keto reductase n=1 Tax=Phytoactinopolyspora limicola TaxID=2715536 RepID=UPI0031B64AD9
MEHRPAGSTRARVTTLSLGGAGIGNLHHAISDDDADATLDAAWQGGIRYFDTAPHYGLGRSERRLGTALRGQPRDEYVISTKVGRRLDPVVDVALESLPRDAEFDVPATHRRVWDFSRDGVLRSVEQSLTRLGVDRIDVLYLHDPEHRWEQALDEAYPTLAQLRDEGLVTAIGAGMNHADLLARFVRATDPDLVMLAGRYTLLEQGALDDLLPLCERRGIGVVAAAVFNSGLLARPRPAPGATYNYEPAPPELLRRVNRFADVCERHGTTLPAAALRFPLAHPAVVSVNVGCRHREEVRRNVELFDAVVPVHLWDELRAEGLLHPDAPTPTQPASTSPSALSPSAPTSSAPEPPGPGPTAA